MEQLKRLMIALGIVLGVLTGITGPAPVTAAASPAAPPLSVALYRYVPDLSRFKTAIQAEWMKRHPNQSLKFVDWNCYESEPQANVDVMVFDDMYLPHYVRQGYLLSLTDQDLENKDDFLPLALDASRIKGTLYGIPQILCTDLLYYRQGDRPLARVRTMDDLYRALGDRKGTSIIPGKNEGLLLEMATKTDIFSFYLDALIDHHQKYTDYASPVTAQELNPAVIKRFQRLEKMIGPNTFAYRKPAGDSYYWARTFGQGHGRAFIGFSEAMSAMEGLDQIDFTPISGCGHKNIPLFYVDSVGVNAAITADKREAAIELANVIAASDTMIRASEPNSTNTSPQYLLPARYSVYDHLGQQYPVYTKLKKIATKPGNNVFRVDSYAADWFTPASERLAQAIKQTK